MYSETPTQCHCFFHRNLWQYVEVSDGSKHCIIRNSLSQIFTGTISESVHCENQNQGTHYTGWFHFCPRHFLYPSDKASQICQKVIYRKVYNGLHLHDFLINAFRKCIEIQGKVIHACVSTVTQQLSGKELYSSLNEQIQTPVTGTRS